MRHFIAIIIFFLQVKTIYTHSLLSASIGLDYELNLNHNKLNATLEIPIHHFGFFDKIDPKKDPPSAEPYKEKLLKIVYESCPIKIDNINVQPIANSLEFAEETEYLENETPLPVFIAILKYYYSIKSPPKKIEFNWKIMPIIPEYIKGDLLKDAISAEHKQVIAPFEIIDGKNESFDFFTFNAKEPQVIWHAYNFQKAPSHLKLEKYYQKHELKISLPIIFGIFFSVLLIIYNFNQLKSKSLLLSIILIMMFSIIIRKKGNIEFKKNPQKAKITKKINKQQAEEIFKTLHSNIFRAFDFQKAEEIYDALAQSIDGNLLEKVFSEIYNSLIMREEGGAVAKVKKVEIKKISTKEKNPEKKWQNFAAKQSFAIQCTWLLDGLVEHFRHIHRRQNLYKANFTLNDAGGEWKIREVQALENKRIDSGNQQLKKELQEKKLRELEILPQIFEGNKSFQNSGFENTY